MMHCWYKHLAQLRSITFAHTIFDAKRHGMPSLKLDSPLLAIDVILLIIHTPNSKGTMAK